jgi:hypothetical protein
MNGREEINLQALMGRNLNEGDHLDDLDVDERILLKWVRKGIRCE